jgi:sucrose-phosphate synthase
MTEGSAKAQTTSDVPEEPDPGLYLALFSIHGLIRGQDLELGRDPDTGGQVLYVVELARALAAQPGVERVDLFTRRVVSPELSDDYAQAEEMIGDGARIVRIDCGPPGYIPKEQLWDHLDTFADNTLAYFDEQAPRLPDLLHSHYADAGYVGSRLTHQLGIPLIHTGHSLGRVKRRRLLASGLSAEEIEQRYNMARRIEAEELTLASAERVIASTHQEIEEQYGLYDHYQPEQMRVIPPGTNLVRFHPPDGSESSSHIATELGRFLHQPERPIILALSRPDVRKNIAALLTAYGESPQLQQLANLVIVAGNRDDIAEMPNGSRDVMTELLLLVDRYDLYGKVALPKHHNAEEVPVLYRLAAASRGVFVNPALTEPFGLTLIEAAASGLPIVATEDGGPRDIIANCANGLLIDPLDSSDIERALSDMLQDADAWQTRVEAGLRGVRAHYAWPAHARVYLGMVQGIVERTELLARAPLTRRPRLYHDRAIFTDIDQSLLGDPKALAVLVRRLRDNRNCAAFGIATGRRFDATLKLLRQHGIPEPDVLITSGGTEIHYAPKLNEDVAWRRHIDHHWAPHKVREVLDELPGLKLQSRREQSRFKISYYIDPNKAPDLEEIQRLLHQAELSVNAIQSFGQFLDILPIRASKDFALRYVASRWEIPLEHILAAGGSGADEGMIRGNTLGVVVANRHHEELSQLVDLEGIYFAHRPYAGGILEAIDHYDFFGSCHLPDSHWVA